MKKLKTKCDNFPLIVLIATERIATKNVVNSKYETKLSLVNEFKGLIVQEIGLGTLLIIPEKPKTKRIRPIHTAHQSSDLIKVAKIDFEDI